MEARRPPDGVCSELLGQMGINVCTRCGETAPMHLAKLTTPRRVGPLPLGQRTHGWALECHECGDQRDVTEEEGRGWARGLVLQQRYAGSETMRRRG